MGVSLATCGKITDIMIDWETPLVMKAGVVNGAMSTNVPQLIASCPTGNCTWPLTPTLAICGGCTNVTSYQTYCFEPICNSDEDICVPQCNYTMPSGSIITLANFTQGAVGVGGVGFQVKTGKGATYDLSDTSRLYVANFDIFGSPVSVQTAGQWPNESTVASECALWFCVQTFNTTVIESNQQQKVIESFSTMVNSQPDSANGVSNVTFAELPPSMQSRAPANYNIGYFASGALSEYLSTALSGTVTLDIESVGYSNDVVQAIWYASADLNGWIDNVAASMSQVVRTYTPQSDSVYDGTASILIYEYQVHWGWIAMPVMLVVSSVVLLVVAISRTNRHPICAWKGSPLALLYMKLDPTIRSQAAGRLDAYDGLQDSIGKIGVYLERDQAGSRTFRRGTWSWRGGFE